MSQLRVFAETDGSDPITVTRDPALIAGILASVGVRFERWQTDAALPIGASADDVMAAYRSEIERLMLEQDYRAMDVISLTADHPDRDALRRKFLNEHTHAEDEVRFFVAGGGLFTLHLADQVYALCCEAGDLIGVPSGTRHWFDMGPEPYFIAIRIFTNPAGWVAQFTGDAIADRFPRYQC